MSTVHEPSQSSRMEDAVPQAVTVNVTPVFGNGTICEIDAGDGPSHSFVHGGIIHLHGNSQFTVTWQLQAGTSGLQFDTTKPIWSSQSQCPTGPCQDGQINPTGCTATTLQTTITPSNPPNAVHISLGWSNQLRCDPIIINH